MADEKLLKDELLNDEQLENVAGGSLDETYCDAYQLYQRGLLTIKQVKYLDVEAVTEILHKMGYNGYKAIDGKDRATYEDLNIYTDKNGNKITREKFWKNFDAENGTSIL
jgi:hypothetical protein